MSSTRYRLFVCTALLCTSCERPQQGAPGDSAITDAVTPVASAVPEAGRHEPAHSLLAHLSLVATTSSAQKPADCDPSFPNPPPVTVSAQLPVDVCIPTTFSDVPFPFFDDFSWRSFIALVWPAMDGQRGVPDTNQTVGVTGQPLVFETFKADWEIFQPNGAAPAAWEETGKQVNPCAVVDLPFGGFVLASFSKFNNLGQADFGPLVGPLVAQNKTYTRFLAGFNEVEFSTIVDKQLYLRKNLGTPASPQVFAPDANRNNPIDIKSSWVDMTNVGHPERYYTRKAWLLDPATGQCAEQTVGLVGLHIVTKTSSRPQWIWSTFEQIDNVPSPTAKAPFTYNDGTPAAMPAENPILFPPPPTRPPAFNVTRTKPIAASTAATNAKYQEALAHRGTGVWQFYQLVMTQWPVPGSTPANTGKPANTFPGTAASTAFSNVTMETFDQDSINTGCMACHTVVKQQTDFQWALNDNAFPPLLGTNASQPQLRALRLIPTSPELLELKQLMESAHKR